MGIHIKVAPHIVALMNEHDQATYGPGIHPPDEIQPPIKTDASEKKQQSEFADWCLLHELPFCWHSTVARSKATPGTPDFIVGVNQVTLWIEFKRDYDARFSKDQQRFKALLERQGIKYYVVYSALEAIRLVEQFDVMDPREHSMPDFASWPTSRLQFMLHEYEDASASIRALYGHTKQAEEEEALYRSWMKAIEAELAKRKAIK